MLQAGHRSLPELRIGVVEDPPTVLHRHAQAEIDIQARIARIFGKSSHLVEHFAANGKTRAGDRRPVPAPARTAEDSVRMFRLARENIREISVAIEYDSGMT